MNTILTLLLVLTPAAFAFKQVPVPVCQASENSSVSKDLRKAPTEVLLDGRALSLSAYPWRDFMPSTLTAPDGSPMMVVLKVATSDKKPFPSGVRMDGAWILFGDQIWQVSELRGQGERSPDNKDSSGRWINCPDTPVCQFTVRGGPKWGPGVLVDVVVRLTDKDGRHYLLQAPKQSVKRSD